MRVKCIFRVHQATEDLQDHRYVDLACAKNNQVFLSIITI